MTTTSLQFRFPAPRLPTQKVNVSLHHWTFFLFCEDSHSSVLLSAVPWCRLPAKVSSRPNYLAVFIIQRLCRRQEPGTHKENCFHTYKWKRAGRLRCNPLFCVDSISNRDLCISALFILFQFHLSSSGTNWPMRNTNPRKANVLSWRRNLPPHERLSGTVATICSLLWWFQGADR